MSNVIQITSNNFNGQYADITFYPCSGGSISLGYQLLPYDYAQDNYEGTYDIYVSAYTLTCQLVIACPSPTPTNTPTMTVTPTVTVTPTMTVTPTNTVTPTPTVSPGPAFDPDAATYLAAVISAGGTTDATISAATDTLFTSLKSNGLYNKMISFYPIVGGVQNAHSIDGKNPSGSYNLSYTNTWTHSVSGQTCPSNGYALLNYIIPSGDTSGCTRNYSYGVYVNTNTDSYSSYEIDMGVRNNSGGGNGNWRLIAGWAGTNDSRAYNGDTANECTFSPRGGAGFYVGTRTLNTGKLYFNGTLKDTKSPTTNETSQYSMALGAEYNGSSGSFQSSKRQCFAFQAAYLDDTEISNLSTIINTFQTTLGRNTY